ncbi:hypothetical protein AURDEDRAFT_64231 [Auricularia subglabra TFB-10046 SS5]|nr:hypothetical protein AURDEDRAFT_64231 [Auricularia subglabra TFB-10046 SS5]
MVRISRAIIPVQRPVDTRFRAAAQEAPAAEGRDDRQPSERRRACWHHQPDGLHRAVRGARRPQRGRRRPVRVPRTPRCLVCVLIAASPPPKAQPSTPSRLQSPPTSSPKSPDPSVDAEQLRSLVKSQQQTINLLVSEKSSLAASLERLQGVEAESQQGQADLQAAREEIESLLHRSSQAEDKLRNATSQLEQASAREEQNYEKHREQARLAMFGQIAPLTLHSSKRTISDLRAQLTQIQQRYQDLEEQIQADDRVENLEKSLKGAQDRADSLEAHLSKLRQTHAQVKSERDNFEAQLKAQSAGAEQWKNKYTTLEQEHKTVSAQLASTSSERDSLASERDTLQSQFSTSQRSLEEFQRRLSESANELAQQTRLLQSAQAELAAATRRADDAERIQYSLQTENVTLVGQLEEMRPKIAELTNAKLELGESAEALQRRLRAQDDQIAQLDAVAQDLRQQVQERATQLRALEAEREALRDGAQTEKGELVKAHGELQAQLATAHASIRELDAERAAHRHAVVRNQEELVRLTSEAQQRAVEASGAQTELEELRRAHEEMHALLKSAQTDVEALRVEILARDDEIVRLKQDLAAASSAPVSDGEGAAQTLDGEMLSALRQQHALDLSAAHATVRELETSAFEAQAEAHRLQKRVTALEDELAHAKLALHQRVSRPSSALSGARSPPGTAPLPPATRPAIVLDEQLTPETRHKRRVSLSMLKARMDSEMGLGAHVHGVTSPLRRNLSNLSVLTEANAENEEPPPPEQEDAYVHVTRRPQFLDDSHVFWCSACKGDLVVL